jgi:hypothetical protein
MERAFGGEPADTSWTARPGTVDEWPESVDEPTPSVDGRPGTLHAPRNYILW